MTTCKRAGKQAGSGDAATNAGIALARWRRETAGRHPGITWKDLLGSRARENIRV